MRLTDNWIGIYEKAIPTQFNWEERIQIAKAAGYDFIELSIDESDARLKRLQWSKEQRQELRNVLKKYDMKMISMCLSGHRRFPFGSKDPQIRQLAKDIMEQAIILAKDLGITNIQLAGYDVYYEDSTKESLNRFVQGLQYSAHLAERYNIMLTIEIMDTYLIGTISRALSYVRLINSPNLRIYPDLGNLSQWSDDPSSELRLGSQYIEAIHLKDTKPGVFKCVPFGEGTVEFWKLFNTLRDLQYDKPFLVEMWADNDKSYTKEDSIMEIKEARLWLQSRM
ncbi:L-ribulose-5-phosphate 3-epimerase [Candidatus Xianfuyuplasma coldseepsis]|uniref:L-ribulose-5-phosphate 3-epimerase n=1 Tax=Candidatus Xianfuyuplasma coldseepsis TaxID=2782163 RepID=A0A7L7KUT6_9MOLU|nr:L-ribulose-5-phosphate 3-epimerase [Xianfuyuplasma coldseepsis]QMS85764.1 L-ribulose-5-phosphate 3-epimerase [Xianfuyuplasma coldseepsis]